MERKDIRNQEILRDSRKNFKARIVSGMIAIFGFSALVAIGYLVAATVRGTWSMPIADFSLFGKVIYSSRWLDLFIVPIGGVLSTISFSLSAYLFDEDPVDIISMLIFIIGIVSIFAFIASFGKGIILTLLIAAIWFLLMILVLLIKWLIVFWRKMI